MDAVISLDEARHTEEPSRVRVRPAGTWVPSLGTGVWMGVECCDHHRICNRWRNVQIESRTNTCRCPENEYIPIGGVYVNPATFFMALDRIAGKRIYPGLFQSLSHHRLIQEIRGRWRLHSLFARQQMLICPI